MLFHSWHSTAWGFGKSRLCSDPGQASIACLIKSKVLNMSIYPACHHAHAGQCEHSYINSWRIFSNSAQSAGSFTPGPQNSQPQPRCQSWCHSGPSSPPRTAHQGLAWMSWERPPALWLCDSWRVRSALSLAQVQSQAAGAAGFGEGRSSFRDDSEVLTHQQQAEIDLQSCLPCFPSGRQVPEGEGTGRLMSQLLSHPRPQCSVMGSATDPGSPCETLL